MARFGRLRPGPIGVAIALYDVWRRLPPKQRRQVLKLAAKHGPKAAAKVIELRRKVRGRR